MHLVTSTEAVPVAHQSDDEPQQVHLAILRVCQQLYSEGFGLFMTHNVPRVSITINSKDTWVMDWHSGRDGPCEAIAYNEFLRDTIPKFSRLRFEFSESQKLAAASSKHRYSSVQRCLEAAVQWIKKCDLREKEVTFAFDPSSIQLFNSSKGSDQWPLMLFGRIRCKKLHLLGVEDDVQVANLIRVIEGRLSVPKLEAACDEIILYFEKLLVINGRKDNLWGDDRELWSSLHRAARVYDVVKCEEIRARLMARCDVEVKDLIRRHEDFKVMAARPLGMD